MLLVPTETLKPGMKLARAMLHPDRPDLLLLAEGSVLDAPTIDHLRSHRVPFAWIAFPGLEEIDPQVTESLARGHLELYSALNRSIDHLERRVQVGVNITQYKRAVHSMLTQIIDCPEHDPLTHQLLMCGPRMTGHLANCAYLALLVGAHLGGYLRAQRRALPPEFAENTAMLGLGALLHDIGKLNMPDELREASILDPDSATREYRSHVHAGYEEVREHLSPVAAHVVLNHHQRFDGSGFPAIDRGGGPEPMAGQRIHVFSRITAVVDVFDHLLCPKGKPLPTLVAFDRIRSERFRGWFDPVILEALLRVIPPFMVGQIVRLSDSTSAVVMACHPDAPCRPTVKVLSGEPATAGTKGIGRPVDLRMTRKVTIAEVDGVDVRPYLYSGDFEGASQAA